MKPNTCPNGHELTDTVRAANGAFVCDFCPDCGTRENGWRYWWNVGQVEQYHWQHQGEAMHDLRDIATASINELERLADTVKNMTEAQLRDAAERMRYIVVNFRALAEELEE